MLLKIVLKEISYIKMDIVQPIFMQPMQIMRRSMMTTLILFRLSLIIVCISPQICIMS
jgi:hypothetical protein